MIYQPHMEQSDWSKFTTMVQVSVSLSVSVCEVCMYYDMHACMTLCENKIIQADT